MPNHSLISTGLRQAFSVSCNRRTFLNKMINLQTAQKSEDLIVVSAKLIFKSTDEGGKSNPIRSGYRPNHSFEEWENNKNRNFYIGEIQFDDMEFIYPGESSVVTVIFMKAGGIEKYLIPGRRWYIYEVPRLVAVGEILHIN